MTGSRLNLHYHALDVLKAALRNTHGARFRALQAVALEYAILFKTSEAELFQLSEERYGEVLATEIHAQADLARRLSFETDWVWWGAGE